jgi:DNA-binding transcriptional regulator YdaS (Cro superfamily)
MRTIDSREALLRAAATFGGFAELARKLGVTPQAVGNWHMRGRVPAERVLEIERLTSVSRHALRPDIYPIEAAE